MTIWRAFRHMWVLVLALGLLFAMPGCVGTYGAGYRSYYPNSYANGAYYDGYWGWNGGRYIWVGPGPCPYYCGWGYGSAFYPHNHFWGGFYRAPGNYPGYGGNYYHGGGYAPSRPGYAPSYGPSAPSYAPSMPHGGGGGSAPVRIR